MGVIDAGATGDANTATGQYCHVGVLVSLEDLEDLHESTREHRDECNALSS